MTSMARVRFAILAIAAAQLWPTQVSAQAARMNAVPDVEISGTRDAKLSLTRVQAIVARYDGSVVTAHPVDHQLQIFSSSGALIRTIGRQGKGPGEFTDIYSAGIRGDTIWAFDPSQSRLTMLSKTGDYLQAIIVTALGWRPVGALNVVAMLSNGDLAVRQEESGPTPNASILRITRDGRFVRELLGFSLTDRYQTVANPNTHSKTIVEQPFAHPTLFAFTPRGDAAVVVEQEPAAGRNGVFTVKKVGMDGKVLYARRFSYVPRPISQHDVDSIVTSRIWMAGPASPTDAKRLVRASLYVPKYFSPISSVAIGTDGKIWIRFRGHESEPVSWMVLNGEGRQIGALDIRARTSLVAPNTSGIWMVTADELDVPIIKHYKIQ